MSDTAEFNYFTAIILWYILVALGISAAALMIGCPIYLWVRDRQTFKRNYEAAFEGRQRLGENDFYDEFFHDKGVSLELVKRIRRILEDVLGADLSRLDTRDSFSTNLGFFFEYDSLVDVELVMRLEEEFNITISDEEAAGVSTIESIIDLVSNKTREKNS